MNTHPYLRAYMAGIALPTMLLLVPNLFGAWNMFYLWLRPRRHFSIGLHGALLPFLLAPIAFTIATSLGFLAVTPGGVVWFQTITVHYAFVATGFTAALAVYYLVWKHVVAFFNQVLGI